MSKDNRGLLHEQLFFETSGEFLGVWERVKPESIAICARFGAPRETLSAIFKFTRVCGVSPQVRGTSRLLA